MNTEPSNLGQILHDTPQEDAASITGMAVSLLNPGRHLSLVRQCQLRIAIWDIRKMGMTEQLFSAVFSDCIRCKVGT